jgi:hypothetical protein
MPDILAKEMAKTAAAKAPDKKTGRLALLFCQQCFRIKDARIVDDRSVVATNLDFDFMNELGVIGVVNQMCEAYGLTMEIQEPNQQRHWTVTIDRPDDHTFTAPSTASSPVLRKALLQAAISAHSQYVKPYL